MNARALLCCLLVAAVVAVSVTPPPQASAAGIEAVGTAISSAASSFGVTYTDENSTDLSGSSYSDQTEYEFMLAVRARGGSSPDILQEWTALYGMPGGYPLYVHVWRFDPEDAEEAYQLWASRYDDEVREFYSAFQGMMPSGYSAREVRVGDTTGTEWTYTAPGGVTIKRLAWRQGPLVAEVGYDGGTSPSGFADMLFDELAALDLGSDAQSGPADALPEPDAPADGLTVSVSPANFTELGDEVRVSVTLSGADSQGAAVTLSGHGRDLSAVADAGGSASFALTHDDESVTEYRFTLTAGDVTREIVVPVLAVRITAEENPATGEPYAGVVADGRSTLAIEIELAGDAGGTLRVAAPESGVLGGEALADDGTIAARSSRATLVYEPPRYVSGDRLTASIAPPQPGSTLMSGRDAQTRYSGGGVVRAATVPLEFVYTAVDGRETQVVFDVLVSRPPVMLVHGFTGDATTWARLHAYLGERGFDAVINEYYAGNQGVHDQAELLGNDIARERGRYETVGFKIAAVDVVGHSMGGLIAREYAFGLPPHPTDVRKIVMVGTPNHGATFTDKLIGNVASEWSGAHSLASEQLYSGSAFMAQINGGEAVGRHLAPDVQYGNIYGVRDDWVVTESSAWLNGVAERRIRGVKHSAAIPMVPGVPLTDSGEVMGWVVGWLSADIPRVALRDGSARVVSGTGDVYVSGIDASGAETRESIERYPREIAAWEHVGTGADSRARVRLFVAGLAWGSIDLAPDTLIALGNVTPDSVTVRVRRGSARFRSLKRAGGGHFQVVLGEMDPGAWMTLHPDAKVIGLDTDFVVAAGGSTGDGGEAVAEVLVLEGSALFDDTTAESEDAMARLEASQAGAVGASAGYESRLAAGQWWTESFYRPSLLEVVQEWWAIVWSQVREVFGSDAP